MSNSIVDATFVVESTGKEFTIPVDRSWPINDVINRILLQSIHVSLHLAITGVVGSVKDVIHGVVLYLNDGVLSPNLSLSTYGYQEGDVILVRFLHVSVF